MYNDVVLADSPLGYWRLNDTSDSSGGGLTLTATGTPTLVASLLPGDTGDGARSFSGSGQSYAVTVNKPTGAMSIEAWFTRTNTAAIHGVCGFRNADLDHSFYILCLSGSQTLELRWRNSAGVAVALAPIISTFPSHVVFTYNGSSRITAYVNGVQRAQSLSAAGTFSAGTMSFGVGQVGGSNVFNGTIDEVALYGTELTLARALAHYEAGIIFAIHADFSRFPKPKLRSA